MADTLTTKMNDLSLSLPSSAPSSRSVIIIGAGIAGLTLANFLKAKGWNVDVYEKVPELKEIHGGLYLQPNGVKVMSVMGILPDLLHPDKSAVLTHMEHTSWSHDPSFLISCPLAADVAKDAGGYPFLGIRRSLFQLYLFNMALKQGVKVHFSKTFQKVDMDDTSVTVAFADGTSATASFIIACDGLHSGVRRSLFGEDQVSYTGLSQVAAISPTPKTFPKEYAFRNFYGPAAHIVFYNVSDTHSLFAATIPEESPSRETWGPMSVEDTEKWKKETHFATWGNGVADCILAAPRVVKYGLYDREHLSTWHKGRALLIGDAAHPTSPHLGQGANQALEDVYHLVRHLPPPPESATSPPLSTSLLDKIWTEYETHRIIRTASFVQGARKMGEDRTQADPEKIKERDEKLIHMYDDKEAAVESWQRLSRHPFWKESEVMFGA